MNTYKLSVKTQGLWQTVCFVQAAGVSDALKQGMTKLAAGHAGKPIKLEQELNDVPARQSCGCVN